ncbi:MAG: serpin family protein [Gemmatimonadaceae bacterium]|nr:serpin family protein [Gemmatimonadaceae bacterium]
MVDPLKAVGMPRAFDEMRADFTGMYAPGGLYLSRVAHRTWLDVNEEGTEATAATATGVGGPVSASGVLTVDAPFLFAIRERLSGAVLFVGTIVIPRAP